MEWGILLVLVTLIFVLLAVVILPKRFLRFERNVHVPSDLGTKKFKTKGGRSFVFEPTPDTRKYIKKYAVICDTSGSRLVVEPDASVYRIAYDVLSFDAEGNLISTINVEESFSGEYGEATSLPFGTSRVSIVVKKVNGEDIGSHETVALKRKGLAAYLVLFFLLAFGECVCVNFCFGKLFGGLFGESFTLSWIGFAIAAGESFVFDLICAILIRSFYGKGSNNKVKKAKGGRK